MGDYSRLNAERGRARPPGAQAGAHTTHDSWLPDEEFLFFLEHLPLRHRLTRRLGRWMLDEMRAGSAVGKELYTNSLRDYQERFAEWKNTRRAVQ